MSSPIFENHQDREDFNDLVLILKGQIERIATKASDRTKAQYWRDFERMRGSDDRIKQASQDGVKKTYYKYRAAWLYGLSVVSNIFLTIIEGKYRGQFSRLERQDFDHVKTLLEDIEKYPPDPKFENKNNKDVNWNGGKRKGSSKSKRPVSATISKMAYRVRLDPANLAWEVIEKNFKKCKYAWHIAAIWCVGARTAEFDPDVVKKGVLVKVAGDECLSFLIHGAKTSGDRHGQTRRGIQIRVTNKPGRALYAHCLGQSGKGIVLKANATELQAAFRYWASKVKAWSRMKRKVTAYVARHHVSSLFKQQLRDPVQVAKAMGHCTDRSQQYYGSKQRLVGGGNKILSVAAPNPIKLKRDPKSLEKLLEKKAKSGSTFPKPKPRGMN